MLCAGQKGSPGSFTGGEGEAFWNVYSYVYDAIRFSIPYDRQLDALVEALASREGERVLDVGCATGNLELRFAERLPAASILGVDNSPAMLDRATRKSRRLSGVGFARADLTRRLPFKDGSFDGVVGNNVLYAMPERAFAVGEMTRVLAKGGRLVLSDPKPDARIGEVIKAHFAALAALPATQRPAAWLLTVSTLPLAGLAPMLLSTLFISRRIRNERYHFSSKAELIELLAGFADVKITSAYADQSWLVSAVKA